MATQPEIIYEAAENALPGPLPTTSEILTSEGIYMKKVSGDFTVRVGTHYVVKYGPSSTRIREGENMLFVKQATTIPVPTVYKIYKEGDKNFLVMEHVPGKTLKEVWPQLPLIGKQTFTRQIRRYIQELRAIPSPGYYGGLSEQGVLCPILTFKMFTEKPIRPLVNKPSRTEAEWCAMMLDAAEALNPGELPAQTFWVQEKLRSVLSEGHEPKFTHCDIVDRKNHILRPDGVIVPLDWEHAGWYPSYWEYCLASALPWQKDDWAESIMDIFKDMEYVVELGWMIFFRKRMRDVFFTSLW